eukprot:5196513-Pyramimonas_sp.AAC.1
MEGAFPLCSSSLSAARTRLTHSQPLQRLRAIPVQSGVFAGDFSGSNDQKLEHMQQLYERMVAPLQY